ncbi:hypothetical protein CASFOL_002044 [Castilleja foliolosa]|uniref:Uncharacterized protein n=1 Tax=Castilleja foliolosa TaxID=1961234 RepID=A0ABD3ED50_9LAMI
MRVPLMAVADRSDGASTSSENFNFLIVSHENGGFRDLFKFLVYNDRESEMKMVGIIVIKVFGKPMEWFGYIVEFILNLLSLNGNFLGLLSKILHGNVSMPKRGSETFISAIGHLDGRIDLFREITHTEMGNRALMDICVMASKLAYENDKVVKNVIDLHWKMHFVAFYNCWNAGRWSETVVTDSANWV